jgi:ABC-type phosphate transport system permease subunit
MKKLLFIVFLASMAHAQAIPDPPKAHVSFKSYFHVRTEDEPALKFHWQEFASIETTAWTTTVFDIRRNRNVQGRSDAIIPAIISTGFHFFAGRYISQPIGLIFPVYLTVERVRGIRGNYQ